MSQPTSDSWKQEVNRRIAAHKNRRGPVAPAPPAANGARDGMSSRAAQVAARVAARYAKAPSYSEMQAAEARVAVRAAEIATQVALEAQAMAESVLADLDAAAGPYKPEPVRPLPAPSVADDDAGAADKALQMGTAGEALAASQTPARADAKLDQSEQLQRLQREAQVAERASLSATQRSGLQIHVSDWWEPATAVGDGPAAVDPAQPIPANLIEFPRELVAKRKARPRLADGPFAFEENSARQLSIFEVDPYFQTAAATEAVSALADAATIAEPAAQSATEAWPAAAWSEIELQALPDVEEEVAEEAVAKQPKRKLALDSAFLSRRALSAVFDFALVSGALMAAAVAAAAVVPELPSPGACGVMGLVALVVSGVVYLSAFLLLTDATPGMRYAKLALSTFDGHIPSTRQRFRRLFAMILSLLPLGLGAAWCLFDEELLSWHDRYSHTYLRRR